jgi:hypothetical protein
MLPTSPESLGTLDHGDVQTNSVPQKMFALNVRNGTAMLCCFSVSRCCRKRTHGAPSTAWLSYYFSRSPRPDEFVGPKMRAWNFPLLIRSVGRWQDQLLSIARSVGKLLERGRWMDTLGLPGVVSMESARYSTFDGVHNFAYT